MSFLKKRFYVGVFLILTIALWSLPTTALADSGTATFTLTAGILTETGDFSHAQESFILQGADDVSGYFLGVQVKDATGSGNGWNLQISATPFSDGINGHPQLTRQFNLLSETSAFCAPSVTCTPPVPTSFAIVQIGSTPVKFYSATPNTGMGIINVVSLVHVVIPGNAFVGTYTSTVTLAIASGP